MATEQDIIDFLNQPPTSEIGKALASPEGKELFRIMKNFLDDNQMEKEWSQWSWEQWQKDTIDKQGKEHAQGD